MGIKRDKIDDLFSKCVRERASWTCEVCGKYYPEGNRQGLHCSHFYSRRYKGLRYHPLNAAAHCFACHQKLGGNPIDFNAWIEGHLGKVKTEALRVMSSAICKLTKADREDIYQNLKASLERMNFERAAGDQGRLEFESPYND